MFLFKFRLLISLSFLFTQFANYKILKDKNTYMHF